MKNKIKPEDLILSTGGTLNPSLVAQQNLTLSDVKRIINLHNKKDQIMRDAHDQIKEIEFEMQKAWNFELDESKHTHRFEIPYPEPV